MERKLSRYIILYYVVLICVTLYFAISHIELESIGRVLYCSAVLLPAISNIGILPAALSCFWGISLCIFVSLFPSTTIIVISELLFVIILSRKRINIRISFAFVVAFLYVLICNLIYNEPEYSDPIEIAIIIVAILSFCISKSRDVELLASGLVLMATIISIIFIFSYNAYLYEYAKGLDRGSWINPNYLGGHVSLGLVCSVWLLFYSKTVKNNKVYLVLLGVAILLCLVTLFLNASRGSILAATFTTIWFILASKNSNRIKFASIILLIGSITYLYYNSYLDLLIYRFEENDIITANGRTTIWDLKLKDFLNSNFLELIFGRGQLYCDFASIHIRSHNDFVTALISYGFVGLLLFLYIIFKPLISSNKLVRSQVFGLLIFLIVECCVLEPLLRGYLIFYVYYLLIYKLSQLKHIY